MKKYFCGMAFSAFTLVGISCAFSETSNDPCAQPSPAEMAEELGIELPSLPWHVANIWWDLEQVDTPFESLEIDVEIDRDVSSDYNLYISPCGVAKINDLQFYGGIQSNINGWASAESRTRVHVGKGGIFSRWSSDLKTPIGLDHVRVAAEDCLVESAGYEGEFASVRRPFQWTNGKYTWGVYKSDSSDEQTWFACKITDSEGAIHEVGSLRFEGTEFKYWPRHSAFVEVYSTSKIPQSNIPKVNVTFSDPRINGSVPTIKGVSAYYPNQSVQASPDCAKVAVVGDNYQVSVGPIFVREESERRHELKRSE